MTRRRAIPWDTILFGGVVLGAIGVLAFRPTLPPIPQRVALLGDSYAVGLGPELAKLLPDFRYEGHVGTNTAQWSTRSSACGDCGRWLMGFRPSLVLVSLGVNDGSAPRRDNYQAIVRELHGLGARVIWLMPPDAVNTPARNVIESLGVPIISTSILLASDGLHPRSYAGWAAQIAKAVRV